MTDSAEFFMHMNKVVAERHHNTWDHLEIETLAHVVHMKSGRIAFSLYDLEAMDVLDNLVDIGNYCREIYNRILTDPDAFEAKAKKYKEEHQP